jgi:hypothetical protein
MLTLATSKLAPKEDQTMYTILSRLWRTDPVLTGTGLFLLALALPFGLGIFLDPRILTGAPAWLKPLKFAISTGLYALTLAWVFGYLPEWPRLRAIVGRGTAAAFVAEVVMIAGQAARGTTSHFNTATPFDGAIFIAMGSIIVSQTALAAAVAVAVWRQRFADPALGWALRLGLTIAVFGALTGGLMTRPTAAQLAEARVTKRMPISGAHTVGAPDGGPGLPITGWSTRHGDIRVPHFIGLHAWQALPLFVLAALPRGDDRRRTRLAIAAGVAYAAVFAVLLVRALRGLPLLALGG